MFYCKFSRFPRTLCGFSLLLALIIPRPASAYEEHLIEMGEPIASVVIADAAYGHGPEGEPFMYVLVKGPPALFNVFDVRTGERVFDEPLPNTKMSWGMQVAPDGAVYLATNTQGKLFRWRPGAKKVDDLGTMIPGETHLWELAIAEDGLIYSGTYPGGRAFEYNPKTGALRDFGRMAEGADYARGIAVSDRFLFVGTGARVGQLFQIDRQSGEKTEVPLPAGTDATLIGNLRYRDGLLFTPLKVDGQFLVYDVRGEEWQRHSLTLPSKAGPDGKLYAMSGGVYRYEASGDSWESTGFRPASGGPRSYGWLNLGDPGFPGLTLVSTDMRGKYWLYNPATNRGENKTADAQPSPVPLRSSFTGPDGRVYVGGYLSPGAAAAYDPDTKEITLLPGISQVEGWGAHGKEMFIGVYPGAKIYGYDPNKPWDFGKNPAHRFDIDQQQDRPFAFASDGRHVAIGTVPKAGQLGGALTVLDTASGARETFRHPVPDQSVVSLVFHEPTGLFVGGSSISCGLGAEPAATEGMLFLWDVGKRENIWSATPVPGQMGVTGLTADDDGMVWGVSGQYLFRFDPETRKILRVKNLFPNGEIKDPATEWVNGYLNFHNDGNLYGMARSRIFRLSPATWEVEELLHPASYFAQDKLGDILFARNQQTLFRLPFSFTRP